MPLCCLSQRHKGHKEADVPVDLQLGFALFLRNLTIAALKPRSLFHLDRSQINHVSRLKRAVELHFSAICPC